SESATPRLLSRRCFCIEAYPTKPIEDASAGRNMIADTISAATPLPVPPPQGGREPWGAGVRNANTVLARPSFSIAFILSCRRHLDRAGAGAAKAIGPVHVLHIGLRMHIAAGRDCAHHIGHCEHRTVGTFAIERCRKAIITELGIGRLDRILDPAERTGLA